MHKLQVQGVHHITLVGADRQTSIDFWEGTLGMAFVFEQPNLDVPDESHIYFDPGDGRLITVFTKEDRKPDATQTSRDVGAVHHIAFSVSQATFAQAVARLDERGIKHSGLVDRGFMDFDLFPRSAGLSYRVVFLPLLPADRRFPWGGHAGSAQDPGGAGRLQHYRGASCRCDREAHNGHPQIAVGGPFAEKPLLIYNAAKAPSRRSRIGHFRLTPTRG